MDKSKLEFGWVDSSVPNVYILEAKAAGWPMPVGHLWMRWNGKKTLALLDIYVVESARRNGIGTTMLLHLFTIKWPTEEADYIVTENFTNLGKHLRDKHFRLDPYGDWRFSRPKIDFDFSKLKLKPKRKTHATNLKSIR